uniref:FHA domain-containing protein n=1 Tax=Chrysotila carterae TaxID=13221 RepID=A0A7S4EX79_CHRCT|mmetsp:Transcript_5022/g.10974  ORF Transcript_5022/g.10974 Transcript_5022/m.10974 type:complete len:569 (-) Transcript_5022:68-1774(-)
MLPTCAPTSFKDGAKNMASYGDEQHRAGRMRLAHEARSNLEPMIKVSGGGVAALLDLADPTATLKVGRHPTRNDLVLSSLEISKRHCLIFCKDGQLYLRDENSRHGTWLNGARLLRANSPAQISPLDQIELGKVRPVQLTLEPCCATKPWQAILTRPGLISALSDDLVRAVAEWCELPTLLALRACDRRLRDLARETIHHPAWRGRGDNAELLRMAMWKEGDYTIRALRGHTKRVHSVVVGASGELIASGGADGTARLWRRSGECARTFALNSEVLDVALCDSEQRLATATVAGAVALFDSIDDARRQPCSWQAHRGACCGVAWVPGHSDALLTCGARDALCLWRHLDASDDASRRDTPSPIISIGCDLDGPPTLAQASAHARGADCLAVGRSHALTGGGDGVRVWEMQSLSPTRFLTKQSANAVAIDGNLAVAEGELEGSATHVVRCWDLRDNQPACSLGGRVLVQGFVGCASDGASGSSDALNDETAARSRALSLDGATLASGGVNGIVLLWDLRMRKVFARLPGGASPVCAVALQPGHMATAALSGSVHYREQSQLVLRSAEPHV